MVAGIAGHVADRGWPLKHGMSLKRRLVCTAGPASGSPAGESPGWSGYVGCTGVRAPRPRCPFSLLGSMFMETGSCAVPRWVTFVLPNLRFSANTGPNADRNLRATPRATTMLTRSKMLAGLFFALKASLQTNFAASLSQLPFNPCQFNSDSVANTHFSAHVDLLHGD